MRWFWIDRFLEFDSGRRAVAVKNVSLVEEQMDTYMPGLPVMPTSLILEGLAQTAGLLVGERNQFRERVVLAKVGKAIFHKPALAGDTLLYTATIDAIEQEGAICKGTSQIGDTLQAEVELFFGHLDDERFKDVDLFEPADFLRMLRLLGIYDIGRDESGNPLQIPEHLLVAERNDIAEND